MEVSALQSWGTKSVPSSSVEKTKQKEQECVREHVNEQCFFGTKDLSLTGKNFFAT